MKRQELHNYIRKEIINELKNYEAIIQKIIDLITGKNGESAGNIAGVTKLKSTLTKAQGRKLLDESEYKNFELLVFTRINQIKLWLIERSGVTCQ